MGRRLKDKGYVINDLIYIYEISVNFKYKYYTRKKEKGKKVKFISKILCKEVG